MAVTRPLTRSPVLFLLNARNSPATRGGDLSSRLARTGGQPYRGESSGTGNKVRSQREQSAASSCPNRCPRDYCGPPLRRRRAEDFGGNREKPPDQPVVKLLERERLVALRKAATAAVSDTPHLA